MVGGFGREWGSKCDLDVKRTRRGGWKVLQQTRQAKSLQVVVVSFATGDASFAIVCAIASPSSAVLIVKDVDILAVHMATMGAFKGVEGINGPSVVRGRGRPHLDHAACYHDQASSPPSQTH